MIDMKTYERIYNETNRLCRMAKGCDVKWNTIFNRLLNEEIDGLKSKSQCEQEKGSSK